MTPRRVLFACFLTCVGCGPAVDEETTSDAGSTSMGEFDTVTTSEDPPLPPETTGEGSSSSSASQDSTTTGDAGSSSSGGEASSSGERFEADCEALCAQLVEGSCVGLQDSCVVTCQDTVGSQGDAVAAAFGACVSSQPLCFSFLEDCMWSVLYGEEAVEQRYVLEGTGFAAWDGRSVVGVLSANGERPPASSATIEGGQFALESTITAPFDVLSNQRTFYYFVDVDDDGACTDADFVQAAWMENLGTDFSEPVFVLSTTPDAKSAVGLCGQF